MKYGHIVGPIYFRYARTTPIINSPHALDYGVKAQLGFDPAMVARIDVGRNVKLRMLLDDRRRRMTCHARVAWVDRDEEGRNPTIGFSHLSLSDEEFGVLFASFSEQPVPRATFGETVRLVPDESRPVTTAGDGIAPILRDKALTLPVDLIERVDVLRGQTPFSQFVTEAIEDYLVRQSAGGR